MVEHLEALLLAERFYDVSMPIYPGMTVYKNKEEKRPRLEIMRDYPDSIRETRLTMDLHTGTHVDAPLHVLQNGAAIESYALKNLLTPCKLIDLTGVESEITPEDLARQDILPDDFVLLKTKNSYQEHFDPSFVYVGREAAEFLASSQVKGVGIDALGIERSQPGHDTHKILLQSKIIILEGLRLKEPPAGKYFMLALPLPLVGVEASPVRVILLEIKD